jgi:hypothetical protein
MDHHVPPRFARGPRDDEWETRKIIRKETIQQKYFFASYHPTNFYKDKKQKKFSKIKDCTLTLSLVKMGHY